MTPTTETLTAIWKAARNVREWQKRQIRYQNAHSLQQLTKAKAELDALLDQADAESRGDATGTQGELL